LPPARLRPPLEEPRRFACRLLTALLLGLCARLHAGRRSRCTACGSADAGPDGRADERAYAERPGACRGSRRGAHGGARSRPGGPTDGPGTSRPKPGARDLLRREIAHDAASQAGRQSRDTANARGSPSPGARCRPDAARDGPLSNRRRRAQACARDISARDGLPECGLET
jgi:hypothetical protein